MNSRKGLRNAEANTVSGSRRYKEFLEALQRQATKLWDTVLCHSPASNANLLLEEHKVLRHCLMEIEKMQECFYCSSDSDLASTEQRKAALADFVQWANKVDISHRFVEIVYTEDVDGFGLTCTNHVATGSELLQVPRRAIFSWDYAYKSNFLKRAFDCDIIVRSMENVALALMLCCHKVVPASNWRPYIQILPRSFNTPLYFSVELLQVMRPSPLFEDSLLLYRNVARQYIHFLLEVIIADDYRIKKKLCELQKPKQMLEIVEPVFVHSPLTTANFTFSLYLWAVSCISTRVNMIPSEIFKNDMGHPRMIPALIPFLDMANHQFTDDALYEAVHFSDEIDCAEIIAVRDYKPSESVNIFYGWRSNHDFFLHNGFVPLQKNIRDVYRLKIGLPQTKREEARLNLFRHLQFTMDSTIFAFEVKVFEPHFHTSLIQFALIYILDELPPIEQIEETFNSTDNIRKAWQFLRDRFALLRRAYGEISTDSVSALSQKLSTVLGCCNSVDAIRKSMIARLKLSELEILQKAEDFCCRYLETV